MDSVLAFVAVAAVLTVTPGAATALVVRSALRGGPRSRRSAETRRATVAPPSATPC